MLFERVRDLVTEQTDSDTEEATEESVVVSDALSMGCISVCSHMMC